MRPFRNRLAEHRRRRGLTQAELAARAGLSRQRLCDVEKGRGVPSTAVGLALAQALETPVEALFWLDQPTVVAELALARSPPLGPSRRASTKAAPGPTKGTRVALARVANRWVAHPLDVRDEPWAADGTLEGRLAGSRARVAPWREQPEALWCAGCAPSLGVLARRASVDLTRPVRWLERPSATALELLARGQVHLAGAHLYDEPSGQFNVPFVERAMPSRPTRLFELTRWEAGLVVPAGNPRRLRSVADLAQSGVRVLRRESGSGAQRLLERQLEKARVPAERVRFTPACASGHDDAARAVALGAADVAVSIRPVARAHQLDFLPLAEERFDLVVPVELSADARVLRLLDTLCSRAFRRELASVGGYDVARSGAELGTTRRAAR